MTSARPSTPNLIKRNILILGDSLSFPRIQHGQALEDSWPWLLGSEFRVLHYARGGSTIADVYRDFSQLKGYYTGTSNKIFSAAIIQVGIVDCCPRPLPRKLFSLFQKTTAGKKFIRAMYRHQIFRKLHWKPWVKLETFELLLKRLFDELKLISEHIIVVDIAHPHHHLTENVGNFSEAVDRYNAVFRRILKEEYIVRVDGLTPIDLLPDGHHLTKSGHFYIAQQLLRKMEKF